MGAFSLALSLCLVSDLPVGAEDGTAAISPAPGAVSAPAAAAESTEKAAADKPTSRTTGQAVRRMNLVLLQNQQETTSAISVEKFTEFVKGVEGAVNTYLSSQGPYSTTQLLLHCSLKPGSPASFAMTTKPGLPGHISAGLDEALGALPAIPVKSALNMEFVFTVADHQTQLSAEARPIIRAGKLDEAVAMLAPEATGDCKNPYVFQTLGWAYSAKGDFSNAEKTLRRAIELAPRDFDTWSNLVSTYHSEGKIKEADEAAQKSLDCAPDQDATNVVNINNALYSGDWPVAEAILRKQVDRPGQNVAPYQVILACTLRWQGKNEEARKLLKVALGQNLDDYYARLARKQLALLDGDWKTAEELGRSDLSKDPKDYESLFDMGVALKGEGKIEEARKAFQAAVQPVTPKSILNAVNLQIKELSKN
ncbi:MAG: tetratricopeptide repeat protein [Cyanobacteria bacterium REEB67]|nr:tetratricopeptide repeat protein [Cyanobacteria bacterium REEB67]